MLGAGDPGRGDVDARCAGEASEGTDASDRGLDLGRDRFTCRGEDAQGNDQRGVRGDQQPTRPGSVHHTLGATDGDVHDRVGRVGVDQQDVGAGGVLQQQGLIGEGRIAGGPTHGRARDDGHRAGRLAADRQQGERIRRGGPRDGHRKDGGLVRVPEPHRRGGGGGHQSRRSGERGAGEHLSAAHRRRGCRGGTLGMDEGRSRRGPHRENGGHEGDEDATVSHDDHPPVQVGAGPGANGPRERQAAAAAPGPRPPRLPSPGHEVRRASGRPMV